LRNLLRYGSSDFFTFVSIEISTYCNRRCWYCPNAQSDRGSVENKKFLPDAVFYKVIDELASYRFNGFVSPNLYGEPLLDERLIPFVRYTREKLPFAAIIIFTNGDFLTVEYYQRLVKTGVSNFWITQHSDEVSENVRGVLEYRNTHGDNGVHLIFEKLAVIRNRGGLIENGIPLKPNECRLMMPEVSIDYRGNVVLCCHDYYGSVVFGNVASEKLLDIWKKPQFRQLRKKMKKGIVELPICKKCTGRFGR